MYRLLSVAMCFSNPDAKKEHVWYVIGQQPISEDKGVYWHFKHIQKLDEKLQTIQQTLPFRLGVRIENIQQLNYWLRF